MLAPCVGADPIATLLRRGWGRSSAHKFGDVWACSLFVIVRTDTGVCPYRWQQSIRPFSPLYTLYSFDLRNFSQYNLKNHRFLCLVCRNVVTLQHDDVGTRRAALLDIAPPLPVTRHVASLHFHGNI